MADFTLGSWYLPGVPPDWEIMTGYGIRRTSGFPSVFLFAQEALPPATTLERYIAKQMDAAKVLFREPKIREATSIAVPDAAEARQIGLSWPTQDGTSGCADPALRNGWQRGRQRHLHNHRAGAASCVARVAEYDCPTAICTGRALHRQRGSAGQVKQVR